jgi:hypothetical protein
MTSEESDKYYKPKKGHPKDNYSGKKYYDDESSVSYDKPNSIIINHPETNNSGTNSVSKTNTNNKKDVAPYQVIWEVLNIDEEPNYKTNLYCDFSRQHPFDEKEIRMKNLPPDFPSVPETSDIFNLMWGEELWKMITDQTNIYAHQFFKECHQNRKTLSYSLKHWQDITIDEIKKFHGLVMWSGLLSSN